MNFSATVISKPNSHETFVQTHDSSKALNIPPRTSGQGSSVNGGELLLLALATCFCNDLYREATKRNIKINQLEVIATAEFGTEGEPGKNFKYKANISADASDEEIKLLIEHTDKVAEIHNTLRQGVSVEIS